MEDIKQIILDYVKSVELMTVCSVSRNKPWCATVFFAFDSKLNLYFLSRNYRRHSKEIVKNPNVAGTIFSQDFEFGKPVKGIQFEGVCKRQSAKSINKYLLYMKRYPKAIEHATMDALRTSNEKGISLWKIVPKRIKIHDEKLFGSEGRELVL